MDYAQTATATAKAVAEALVPAQPGAADTRKALATALGSEDLKFEPQLAKYLQSVTSKSILAGRPPRGRFSISMNFVTPDQINILVTMPDRGFAEPVATAFASVLPSAIAAFNSRETAARNADITASTKLYLISLARRFDDMQQSLTDLRKWNKELAKVTPNTSRESVFSAPGSMSLAEAEIFRAQVRLANAAMKITTEQYQTFSEDLTWLAARITQATADIAYDSNTSEKRQLLIKNDPATFLLPEFGDKTSFEVNAVTKETRTLKTPLISAIGSIAGIIMMVLGNLILKVVKDAPHRVGRSRFA